MAGTKAARRTEIGRAGREYRRGETVFTAGDACRDVFYIQSGGIRLSIRSKAGHEAVVGTLGAGDFFGEGCLAGQRIRSGTATAITPTVIRAVGRTQMVQVLMTQQAMCLKFAANMLSRTMRIEENLKNELLLQTPKKGRLTV